MSLLHFPTLNTLNTRSHTHTHMRTHTHARTHTVHTNSDRSHTHEPTATPAALAYVRSMVTRLAALGPRQGSLTEVVARWSASRSQRSLASSIARWAHGSGLRHRSLGGSSPSVGAFAPMSCTVVGHHGLDEGEGSGGGAGVGWGSGFA